VFASTDTGPPSHPTGAVFISYASEDAAAAERIATSLRGGGIEVWFDRNELRGGDTWDAQIRRQIRDCTLFLAVISANTQRRHEGYFRLEWNLGDQRTQLRGRSRAFILPVCIDTTAERDADVPDSFLAVQWTRLPQGETPQEFVGRVKHLLAPDSHPLHTGSGSVVSSAITAGGARRARAIVGVLAVAVGLALAYWGFGRFTASKPPAAGAASIAVLPLANESGDTSQQYFSDGISEDLITALGKFPGLKVIGRNSSFQFRDSKQDSRSIGEKLGVAHLLEGSVRKAGDMIRISTELVDTADGTMQWSERYDRPYQALFALQDEITRAVAGELKAKLLPGGNPVDQGERPPGGNLEAYNALLQGRFYYLSGRGSASLSKAIDFYTQATQLDPTYARAWSEMSISRTLLSGDALEGAQAQAVYAKARQEADRALELSPDLAAAHIARGYVLYTADFDWHGAEAEYRRAVALAPKDGEPKFHLGSQLAAVGDAQAAIALTREALATDPLRADWYQQLGDYLVGAGRLDEAEQAIRRSLELQPASFGNYAALTHIAIVRGNAQGALEAARQETSSTARDIALALATQIGTDKNAADTSLATLKTKYANVTYQIAQVYAVRRDGDKAFEWLNRAWDERDAGIAQLLYDPFFFRFKDDPRFAAFCRKVGLPTPAEAGRRT
jgi:TolB-like protein/Tfp pilus assembly protein PilF